MEVKLKNHFPKIFQKLYDKSSEINERAANQDPEEGLPQCGSESQPLGSVLTLT